MKPSHFVLPILWALAFIVGLTYLQAERTGEFASAHPSQEMTV